jgi:thioesterase domain-containing protein
VYLLRGTGLVFSPGFAELGAELRQAGFLVEDLPSFADCWVPQALIAEQRAGTLSGPLILVGHSRGGRHALSAARMLQEAGIAVDLVVCLDVGLPSEVPANIKRVLNLYMHHHLYPSCPLHAAPGAAPVIENVDLKASGSPVDARDLCHITITASPAVRALVVERALLAARAHPAGPGK